MLGLKEEYKPKTATSVSNVQSHSADNATQLNQIIEDSGRTLSVEEISYWADQILNSLNDTDAQNSSTAHRAIKPQNITVSNDDIVNIKSATADESISLDDSANLSYLPLEQIWGGLDSASQSVIISQYDEEAAGVLESPPDTRSDIYSLGAVIYHLATKKIPADALTRSIDLLEGKDDPLIASNKLNSELPKEFSEFISKAMEIRREDRYASVGLMQKALRSAVKVKKPSRNADTGKSETEKVEIPKKFEPTVKEKAVAASAGAETVSAPVAVSIKEEVFSSSVNDSFIEEPIAKGGVPKIALIGAGGVALFSAIFGIWSLSSSSTEPPKPPVVIEQKKPETAQPVTPAVTETTVPEQTAAPAVTADSPAVTAKTTDTAQKQKEAADKKAAAAKEAAALKEKQKQQQAKTTVTQKKEVTVDDLLDVDN